MLPSHSAPHAGEAYLLLTTHYLLLTTQVKPLVNFENSYVRNMEYWEEALTLTNPTPTPKQVVLHMNMATMYSTRGDEAPTSGGKVSPSPSPNPSPSPSLNPSPHPNPNPNQVALLMLLRLYIALRVLRDSTAP